MIFELNVWYYVRNMGTSVKRRELSSKMISSCGELSSWLCTLSDACVTVVVETMDGEL